MNFLSKITKNTISLFFANNSVEYVDLYAIIEAYFLVLYMAERRIKMNIEDVKNILNCNVICGEEFLDREIHTACGADMMSDVLAYVKEQSILLTGLINPQVVRTADMMDMSCIVFVRGKVPVEDVAKLACQREIVLMSTEKRMFEACGLLWENGLKGGECK